MSQSTDEVLEPSTPPPISTGLLDAEPSPAAPETGAEDRAGGLILLVGLCYLGLGMASSVPQLLSLAIRLRDLAPNSQTSTLSWMLGVGGLVAIIGLLVFGRLGDATSSRWGRRRPWLAGAVVGVVIATALLVTADNILVLFTGYLLMAAATSAGLAACYGVVADRVGTRQQGMAGAVIGAANVGGQLVGLFLAQSSPNNVWIVFVLPAALAVLPTACMIATLNDPRVPRSGGITLRMVMESFTIEWRRFPSLAWLLPALILGNGVTAAVASYGYFIVQRQVGTDLGDISRTLFLCQLLLNGVGFVVTLVVGPISDRMDRRKPLFLAAILLFAVGGTMLAFASTSVMLYAGMGVVGVAVGLSGGTYLAMAMNVSRGASNPGRELTVVASCFALSYSFVPFVAPLLLGSDGQDLTQMLTVVSAACALSTVFLAKVKDR